MPPPRESTIFTEAPYWMLLVLLVFAPWAYGCTHPWSMEWLAYGMLATTAVWLAGCAIRRERPPLPWLALACIGLLLLQGWWMIANAQYRYDRDYYKYIQIHALFPRLPGDIDTADAIPAMLRITGLLGMVGLAADLAQRPAWRARLWWTVGLVGASIVLLGLAERITDAETIFWGVRAERRLFFATYAYHANAGAYINLVLPLIFGLVLAAFRRKDEPLARALWIPALLLALAGAIAAASKGALLVTGLMTIAVVFWRARDLAKLWRGLPSAGARAGAALGTLAGLAAIVGIGWTSMMSRWTSEDWMSNSSAARLMAYQATLDMLPDTSWWGFGASNFMIAFPHYTNRFGQALRGIWQFAHCDYLQTVVEWGYFGAAVWAVFYFGGIVQGIRTHRNSASGLSGSDRILLFTVLLALAGVAVHSIFDFPLQIASLQLYAAVYLGLAWSSPRWAFWNPPTPSRRTRSEAESPRVAATHYP